MKSQEFQEEIKNLNNVITSIKEIFDDGSWDNDTFAPKLEKILESYSKSKMTKKEKDIRGKSN